MMLKIITIIYPFIKNRLRYWANYGQFCRSDTTLQLGHHFTFRAKYHISAIVSQFSYHTAIKNMFMINLHMTFSFHIDQPGNKTNFFCILSQGIFSERHTWPKRSFCKTKFDWLILNPAQSYYNNQAGFLSWHLPWLLTVNPKPINSKLFPILAISNTNCWLLFNIIVKAEVNFFDLN